MEAQKIEQLSLGKLRKNADVIFKLNLKIIWIEEDMKGCIHQVKVTACKFIQFQ